MITTNFVGRFGNNIFQYCIGKILADKLNYSLHIRNNKYGNVFLGQDGITHRGPIVRLSGMTVDLYNIKQYENKRIELNGFFQRYEYYQPYKDKILSWLNLPEFNLEYPTPNDLVVHVRGGDLLSGPYNNSHPPGPFAYYNKIIEQSKFDKLYIITENTNDPVAQKIYNRFDSVMISRSVLEDFDFLLHSSRVILSLSTLSWWATYLGCAKEVHFPLIGMWHPDNYRNNLDLAVPEPRYIYHDLYKGLNWCGSEEQIDKILAEKWYGLES